MPGALALSSLAKSHLGPEAHLHPAPSGLGQWPLQRCAPRELTNLLRGQVLGSGSKEFIRCLGWAGEPLKTPKPQKGHRVKDLSMSSGAPELRSTSTHRVPQPSGSSRRRAAKSEARQLGPDPMSVRRALGVPVAMAVGLRAKQSGSQRHNQGLPCPMCKACLSECCMGQWLPALRRKSIGR